MDNMFTKNIAALQLKHPGIADVVCSAPLDPACEMLHARNGAPVCRYHKTLLHSTYDPAKEGRAAAERFMHENAINKNSDIVVFGLGFGYHVFPLLESVGTLHIFEPDLSLLRLACEHVDLTDIFSAAVIVTDLQMLQVFEESPHLFVLRPRAKSVPDSLNAVQQKIITQQAKAFPVTGVINKKTCLKVLVVSPVYGGSYPMTRYCADALEKLGHDVRVFDSAVFEKPFQAALALKCDENNRAVLYRLFQHLISEMIVATCDDFEPDVVLAMAQAPLSIEALQRMREKNIITAIWFVEDYQVMSYWKAYAPHYDLFFTIQQGPFSSELYRCGAKHVQYLPAAADTNVHRPLTLTRADMETFGSAVSFMGAGYYNRQQMFQALIDFDFKIWGAQWDKRTLLWEHVQRGGARISTDDVVKIFNAADININLHSSVIHDAVNPDGDFVNPRTFEIAACGGFQLIDMRRLLPDHFDCTSEMCCFDSAETLREKIVYFLRHADERQRFAQKAYARVQRDHTYVHRMQQLVAFIHERTPEAFYGKHAVPYIADIASFCDRFPETADVLHRAGKDSNPVDLASIVRTIKGGRGRITIPDATFMLLQEFQNHFTGIV